MNVKVFSGYQSFQYRIYRVNEVIFEREMMCV